MTNELTSTPLVRLERPTSVAKSDPVKPLDQSHRVAEKAESKEVAEVKVEQVVEELNQAIQNVHRSLQFSVDKESGKTVIKVVDVDTDEVIREIPPEETRKLAQQISDNMGAFIRTEV